jgi:hypothetical protein
MKKLLLPIVLLLSSCVSGSYTGSQDEILKSFSGSGKALVITKISNGEYKNTYSNWVKIGGDSNKVRIDRSNEYQVVMVEPGLYSLASFKEVSGATLRAGGALYDGATGKPYFASFLVKENEVVYVGDLHVKKTYLNDKVFKVKGYLDVSVSVKNNYVEAKKFFKKEFSGIKKRVIVRLAKGN